MDTGGGYAGYIVGGARDADLRIVVCGPGLA